MEWTKVSIFTSSEGIELVCDMLSELGITGAVIEDEADFTSFLENNKKYWDYVDDELIEEKKKETNVSVYIETDSNLCDRLNMIKTSLRELKTRDEKSAWGTLEIETDGIREEDWANNWKAFFHPIEVGKKILIQPEWEKLEKETDRTVFTVNPGMTFGTGTHHTTKLCIEASEDLINPQTVVLDLGCGSGILSVISLLLGAKEAYGVDIDPMCEHVAYENAALNGVDTTKYHVYSGDVTSDEALFEKLSERKYDLVMANIVADVIIAIAPTVRKLIKEDGIFVCSGIIKERLCDVQTAFEKEKIEVLDQKESGGWVAMKCRFL